MRRGQIANGIFQGVGIALALLMLTIVTSTGSNVLVEYRSDIACATGYSYNATTQGLEGIENVANQEDTMGTVAGAIIIVMLVVGGFMGVGMGITR